MAIFFSLRLLKVGAILSWVALKKEQVMLYSTYSTWICGKNSQQPSHPFSKGGKDSALLLRWHILEWENVCSSMCPVSTIRNHVGRCRWKKQQNVHNYARATQNGLIKKAGAGELQVRKRAKIIMTVTISMTDLIKIKYLCTVFIFLLRC